jgi:hypothetical protein
VLHGVCSNQQGTTVADADARILVQSRPAMQPRA